MSRITLIYSLSQQLINSPKRMTPRTISRNLFHIIISASLTHLLLLGTLFLSCGTLNAQALKGQWTGSFKTSGDVWGGKTEFIMELDMNGTTVEGYSYTYFMISGKRHYVICKLQGTYDKPSRSISVTEVSKVKSNTPSDFKDMFQTHRLTYLKQGDIETLEGSWTSATPGDPAQSGETRLERRLLARAVPISPSSQSTLAASKANPPKNVPADTKSTENTSQQPRISQSPSQPKTSGSSITSTGKPPLPIQGIRDKSADLSQTEKKLEAIQKSSPLSVESEAIQPSASSPKVELRSNKILQIIDIEYTEFTVELYDNGSVDGDTISLFFNNKLMVSHKKLSTSPITLELSLDRGRKENELVMFAESLGEIPPNTALMVVKVKDRRYEVNITSTEQTNGSVRFRLRE